MESIRLSERLPEHLASSTTLSAEAQCAWVQDTLAVVGKFFYGLPVPSTWCLIDIQRFDQKDFIVQQGLDASANALARSLRSIGIRVSRETISLLRQTRGAVAVQQNLERQHVRV